MGPDGKKFNVHNGMHGRLGEASDTGQAFIDDILTAIEKGKTALGTTTPTIAYTGHSLGGGLATICRCGHYFKGLTGANVHVVTFGSPLVIGSEPNNFDSLKDIAATTRNYVYNLDIFPRLLFQQDPELVLNFLSAYIKEHYPAYYNTGGLFGIGGQIKESFVSLLSDFMSHSRRYRPLGDIHLLQANHGVNKKRALLCMSVEAQSCLSQLAGEIPCLPEDQTHYSAARTLADHKMHNYETSMANVCWAAPLESDEDFKFAAFTARFRWQADLDLKD
mmetsp:Transcript_34494/g.55640  ORF Transcript_34494/g.55640 Transcript_34494/m.55640 type:complete len:277 (-) Transcript_34494:61-891(-)